MSRSVFFGAAAALVLLSTAGLAKASDLYDPSIAHQPKDGVIRIFGPGGPHTAFLKAAKAFEAKTGVKVEVVFGPESKWTKDAQAGADMIFGSSEQSMTAFLENYRFVESGAVEPLFIRRSVIVVPKGNPKGISGFADLLQPGMRVVVTEGKGVYNTSGTGVWEDIAGRLGALEDVKRLRRNIAFVEKGSGASFRSFTAGQADAWLTWVHWPLNHPDAAEFVELEEERRIYRVTNVVLSPEADPVTTDFLIFLKGPEAARLFASDGWMK
ncbi:extracellular solute-binding protein [Pelagibius litoralis]|uniref:Extracellular solute-binding protein n=1 Tax=Pelagibius litoralis TaxID=374515 RepID=A0A967K7J0_9PROT|nr:substrate-binding domain-containing protein [Pelagibius litoralis]NIA69868.1 extracellular solute-binding protein [Pelagibius litoralis]